MLVFVQVSVQHLPIFQTISISNNFCIKLSKDKAFIGGTPERLFEIKQSCIKSDALAGTAFKQAGSDVEKIKQRLLNSKKNIGEHQYVVEFIESKFNGLCKDWSRDDKRSLIELKYLLHLVAHFSGELNDEFDWLDCMEALHPTPAVSGTPLNAALDIITEQESFDRGWYAGPMGVVSKQESKIVVAIRSGMVEGNKVTLCAGAGIVNDSEPYDEWNELDAKINLFATIFNGAKL